MENIIQVLFCVILLKQSAINYNVTTLRTFIRANHEIINNHIL